MLSAYSDLGRWCQIFFDELACSLQSCQLQRSTRLPKVSLSSWPQFKASCSCSRCSTFRNSHLMERITLASIVFSNFLRFRHATFWINSSSVSLVTGWPRENCLHHSRLIHLRVTSWHSFALIICRTKILWALLGCFPFGSCLNLLISPADRVHCWLQSVHT